MLTELFVLLGQNIKVTIINAFQKSSQCIDRPDTYTLQNRMLVNGLKHPHILTYNTAAKMTDFTANFSVVNYSKRFCHKHRWLYKNRLEHIL